MSERATDAVEIAAVRTAIAAQLASLPTIGSTAEENVQAVVEAARSIGIPVVSAIAEDDGIVLKLDHPLRYIYGTGRII